MYGNQKGVTFREIKSCQYFSHLHYIKEVAGVSCLVNLLWNKWGKNWRLYILRTDLRRRFEREYYNYPPKKSREKISLSCKTWKKIIGQNRSPIPSLNVSARSLILSEKNKVIYQDNQNQNHAVPITSL